MPRRVESELDILRQRELQRIQQQVANHTEAVAHGAPRVSTSSLQRDDELPSVVTSHGAEDGERMLPATACASSVKPVGSTASHNTSTDEKVVDAPSLPPSVGRPKRTVHIAVQGCCHGELDKIYDQIHDHESATGQKIDFLLCCGDFQSIRNKEDMQSMAVPDKYKTYGDFVKYYRGEKRVPVLTLFIGGNHEASNLLAQEYYGGYVSNGIYYLGHSSVVTVCGVRIGSLSGIYKGRDYTRPYPTVPYDHQSMRDAYHVRSFELEKLHRYSAIFHKLQEQKVQDRQTTVGLLGTSGEAPTPAPLQPPRRLHNAVDIMLSHDWPVGITKYGNEAGLLSIKPYFADDIAHGALGNPYTMELLTAMRPKFWFAAHLHCHFTANVPHNTLRPGSRIPVVVCPPTEFVALDKCIHHSRKCLTFMSIEVEGEDDEVVPHAASAESGKQEASYPSVLMDATWADIVQQTHELVRTANDGRGGVGNAWERSVELNLPPLSRSAALAPQCLQERGMTMTDTESLLASLGLSPNPLVRGGSLPPRNPVAHSNAAPPQQRLVDQVAHATTGDDDGGFSWVEDAVGRVGYQRN